MCREADISRGTFYLHYRNIHEVLDEILDEAFSEVSDVISQVEQRLSISEQCDNPFCQFIRENKKYHCIFLDDALSSKITEKAVSVYRADFIRRMQEETSLTEAQLDALMLFQFSECFSVAKRSIRIKSEEWGCIKGCLDRFIRSGFFSCEGKPFSFFRL